MRVYRNNNYYNSISLLDRSICALSYVTMGFVGFIWIVLGYFRGKHPSTFVKFNCFQSIIISLIIYVLGLISSIFLGIVTIVPFIGNMVTYIVYFIFQYPVLSSFSLYQVLFSLFILYLAGFSFLGKYPEVPELSRHIRAI